MLAILSFNTQRPKHYTHRLQSSDLFPNVTPHVKVELTFKRGQMHDENKEKKRRDLKTLRLSRFVKGRLDLLGNLSVLVLDPSDQQ